jgi:hypothetical protein
MKLKRKALESRYSSLPDSICTPAEGEPSVTRVAPSPHQDEPIQALAGDATHSIGDV